MELHGVTGAPYKTPQVRRKLPAPFTRDRIDLDGARVKRSWKDVAVTEVKKNDVVADIGRIETVVESIELPGLGTDEPLRDMPWRVRLYNVVGQYWDFPGNQIVYAFTPDESAAVGDR